MTPAGNRIRRRLLFLAFTFLGLLAMAVGMVIVLYVYAFASMVDPRLNGVAYWREVLKGMFLRPAVIITLVGLFVALGGTSVAVWSAAVAVGWVPAAAPTRRTWLAIAAGLLALFAVGIIVAALS